VRKHKLGVESFHEWKGSYRKIWKIKKKKKYFVSSRSNKANACFMENHSFLDFLICILLKSLQNLFSGNVFFYLVWVILSEIFSIKLIIKSLWIIFLYACSHAAIAAEFCCSFFPHCILRNCCMFHVINLSFVY